MTLSSFKEGGRINCLPQQITIASFVQELEKKINANTLQTQRMVQQHSGDSQASVFGQD